MQGKIEIKAGCRILFTGDSITDCDHREKSYAPLGNGYVHFAGNLLVSRHPELDLKIINTGINGNTTVDLKKRWEKDCVSYQPDVLSILIGMNDLWRHFGGFLDRRNAVEAKEYEDNYRWLLSQAQEKIGCQIVLVEPFMFCDDVDNEMFRGLGAYIDAVGRLGEEFGASVVHLQGMINEKLCEVPAEKWSDDMVHPYEWVHTWIAERWLQTMGV